MNKYDNEIEEVFKLLNIDSESKRTYFTRLSELGIKKQYKDNYTFINISSRTKALEGTCDAELEPNK